MLPMITRRYDLPDHSFFLFGARAVGIEVKAAATWRAEYGTDRGTAGDPDRTTGGEQTSGPPVTAMPAASERLACGCPLK